MSFPAYDEYADSGVKWLCDLPSHWPVKKIGHLADLITGFAFPSEGFSFDDSDSTIPLVRGESVSEGYLRWGERGRYWPKESPYEERYLLEVDDIVVQMDGSKVGKNWAIVTEEDLPLLLVQRVTRIRCREINPKYVFSLIANEMFVRYVDQAKTDPAVPHITMRNISDYWIPVPPEDEQKAISSFLDVETSKIDGLVSEQRRLIELLKEKRQAVISHAVTKGLNPNAPMKPSGIQWLGDVPQHWKTGKCGFYVSILSGYAFPSSGFSEDENNVRLLRGINVGVSEIKWDETVYWKRTDDDDLDRFELKAGDLVIGMDRPWISSGVRVAKIDDSDLPCLLLQRVAAISTNDGLHTDFLWHLLSSEMFVGYFEPETTGVSVPHISPTQIENFLIPVPPIKEQNQIVEHVSSETTRMDTLIAEAERAIELLQERRTALISAAVTGKIDVRKFAPKEAVV